MSFENNNNISLSSSHITNHTAKPIDINQWADKNIPQSKMNKLIMDYLVTGKSTLHGSGWGWKVC